MTDRTRSIIFYTSNRGKYLEVRHRLAGTGTTVRWGRRTFLEPQADRLEEVVRSKLRQVPRREDAVLVEDSGLFIEALGGFPGVYSAYVLRTLGPSRLLRLLGVRERRAHFVTVFGYAPSRGRVQLFRGEVHGRLADRPRGRHGFGFDPIFVPDGLDRTFAEMELAEKDRRSHRGRALEALAALLA